MKSRWDTNKASYLWFGDKMSSLFEICWLITKILVLVRLFSPRRIPFLLHPADLKVITVQREQRRSQNNRKSWWENSFEKTRKVEIICSHKVKSIIWCYLNVVSRYWALSGLHNQPVLQNLLLSAQRTSAFLKAHTMSFSVLLHL